MDKHDSNAQLVEAHTKLKSEISIYTHTHTYLHMCVCVSSHIVSLWVFRQIKKMCTQTINCAEVFHREVDKLTGCVVVLICSPIVWHEEDAQHNSAPMRSLNAKLRVVQCGWPEGRPCWSVSASHQANRRKTESKAKTSALFRTCRYGAASVICILSDLHTRWSAICFNCCTANSMQRLTIFYANKLRSQEGIN